MTAAARQRLPLPLTAAALAAALAWAGFLSVRHLEGWASFLDRVEAASADMRLLHAGSLPSPAGIAIVAIDDATVAAERGYPLDRRRLAALVEAIAASGARALALDLMLVDPTGEEADSALAGALGLLPAVIAGAGRFAPGGAASGPPATIGEVMPLPLFAGAAAVGLVNVSVDAGGTPRHMPAIFRTGAGPAPSFALRAAALHAGSGPVLGPHAVRLGGSARRLDLGWHLPLRYLGPAGTVATVSAAAVLAGGPERALLSGRTVLVGATATAVGDRFATPFDSVLPGVEVLATGVANLVDGSGLIRDLAVRRIDAAAAVSLACAGVLAVSLLPLLGGAGLFATLAAGWLGAAWLLFAAGYWFAVALPLAASVPPVAAAAALRQLFDRRQARRVAQASEALARLQAPALAARVAADPGFLREPREQRAAILFVDLAGFTGLSERLGPAATRDLLKEFHSLVVREADAHGGLVISFMGDGAMIVFGVPDAAPDAARRALETAFALVAATRDWAGGREDLGVDPPGLRAGVHHGVVVLSRLGHDTQQHITTTGDAVNVASRLMEVGKAFKAGITASAELLAAIDEAGLPPPVERRKVEIRGRREGMEVAFWRAERP